jgi:hypothetical protein
LVEETVVPRAPFEVHMKAKRLGLSEFVYFSCNNTLNGEATNTNVIVFGLTRPGLEPSIYHARGEHSNHYTPPMR